MFKFNLFFLNLNYCTVITDSNIMNKVIQFVLKSKDINKYHKNNVIQLN